MAANVSPTRGDGSQRERLPEEVTGHVRELIMSGQVRPGEFLRIEPIATAVGVSNTPVREGLLALRSEGLVRLVPRRGFMVAPVSKQDIHDLFWTQAMLAAELAGRAAWRITPAEIAKLEEIDAEFTQAAEDGDAQRLAELGHDFHRGINVVADSRRLTLLLGSVVEHLPNRFYASIEGHIATTRDDHPELIHALRHRDVPRARSLTQHHILEGADGVIKTLEERGFWTDEPVG